MLRTGLFLLLLVGILQPVRPALGDQTVPVYFFTAPNCPHCAEARPVLAQLLEKFPTARLNEFDIWGDPAEFTRLRQLVATHGKVPLATPAIFIGDRMWLGFNPSMAEAIEQTLASCSSRGCPDPMQRLTREQPEPVLPVNRPEAPTAETVTLPLLGKIELRDASLPLMTVALGLLDSINPCAFFVLLFLLGLLVHANSKRRMLAIGGTFVLFSGVIYFLFMAAWLNLFLAVGQLAAITTVAAVIAIVVALINIKDFFYFKEGVSLTLSGHSRNLLGKRMRSLVHAASLPAALTGTAVLAIAANSYELLCTAGFPMVFTRILTLQELPPGWYYLYLAAYNAIYVLPLLGIVTAFSLTLGVHKLTEWQGRELKLISGMMMLILGATLLLEPGLLHRLWGAAAMLALAILGAAVIILIYKRTHRIS